MPPQHSTDPKAATESISETAIKAAAADKPVTIELRTHVTLGTGSDTTTWTKLEFSPLRARHLRGLPTGENNMTIGNLLEIAERMAAVPAGVIDELAPEDVAAAMDVVNAFLLRIQGAGD